MVEMSNLLTISHVFAIFSAALLVVPMLLNDMEAQIQDTSKVTPTIIVNHPANQTNPQIYGDTVVWQDDRNGNWDIFSLNLSTNKVVQLSNSTTHQLSPSIWGNYVAWWDYNGYYIGNVSLYSLTQKQVVRQFPAEETKPQLYRNTLGWANGSYLFLYDINLDQLRTIPLGILLNEFHRIRLTENYVALGSYYPWDLYLYDIRNNELKDITGLIGQAYDIGSEYLVFIEIGTEGRLNWYNLSNSTLTEIKQHNISDGYSLILAENNYIYSYNGSELREYNLTSNTERVLFKDNSTATSSVWFETNLDYDNSFVVWNHNVGIGNSSDNWDIFIVNVNITSQKIGPVNDGLADDDTNDLLIYKYVWLWPILLILVICVLSAAFYARKNR